MDKLETRLKAKAHELGFELVGIAPAGPADTFDRFKEWLEAGHAGEMGYMHSGMEPRRHPSSVLPSVRSVIMLGMSYKQPVASHATARVASYALGEDYHAVLRQKMKELLGWIRLELPGCWGRVVVDTAPLLERDFASRAGLGWVGKNTMLLNKRQGSFLFLGAVLIDRELAPDAPHETSHCGTCTACLDACPTEAFPQPGVLDARRCISYLTIEHRGPIEEELRPGIGNWLFGCDICQDVCPWNRKVPEGSEPRLQKRADIVAVDLVGLLSLNEEQFREQFRGTALLRTKRSGIIRNAAIVLANHGNRDALPALARLLEDADSMLREVAGWAIRQIEKCTDSRR